ncbi:MAG: hypothetical protein MUC97_01490 [Bernardetiaceae bacterium]|nr:hypothetical protein [Bernardetiaceae bacterium]
MIIDHLEYKECPTVIWFWVVLQPGAGSPVRLRQAVRPPPPARTRGPTLPSHRRAWRMEVPRSHIA